MMKGGHDSHRGRLSPAHLPAHLIAPCLCPRTAATAETLCRGGSAVAPAAEALRKDRFYSYSNVPDGRGADMKSNTPRCLIDFHTDVLACLLHGTSRDAA